MSIRALLLIFLLVIFVSGCAETKYIFSYGGDGGKELLWPKEHEVARYRYVGQLVGEQNFTAESAGGFQAGLVNALKWIAGMFSTASGDAPVVLQRPQSGVTGPDGRVYVTDVSRQAVYVFDPENGKLEVWRDTGTTGGFVSPIGIVVLSNGQVLVSDAQLAAVIRLDATGKPMGFFAAGIMARPTGLAYDPETDWLYIADSGANDIKVFKSDGSFVKIIGRPGVADGEFNGPTHLYYRDQKLYVTDSLNSRIQIFDSKGAFLQKFGERGRYVGNLPRPKGVAADSEGNVYVIESYNDHMLVFSANGEFLLPLGGTGHDIGQFYLPAGVWVDDQDRVYIADMFNGRVMIFQYLGNKNDKL